MAVTAKVLLLLAFAIYVDAQELKHHIVLNDGASVRVDNDTTVDDDWWKTAIFYQIYPRSFMDSDNDGNGDLQGIIDKLSHLKDMGVTAAWLSPIYKSPGVDQGYDISDYRDVDLMYGNLTTLATLIKEIHNLGIKIIMDFVPNHTSDQHEWFQLSVSNDDTYKDYYVWKDGEEGTPPNNWVSVFGGSAWKWHATRKQFYLHQFADAQPDLNYNNPNVVAEMKDVLTYWLDLGVDGFRMDAVPFLFEDPDFKNEPLTGASGVTSDQYGYLKHIYTTNLDATYSLIYDFRSVLDEYNSNPLKNITYSRIMMTEAYTDTAEAAVLYYGNSTTNGAHFTFNFNLITDLSLNFTADNIITTINKWLSHLDKKYVSNWVLGNHDQHRVATRLGVDNVDALNMLTAFLPGIQVTYMGEEIGMENGEVFCNQTHDPQVKDCDTFEQISRDFERTPYQWDDTYNAGFSLNPEPWLPVSSKKNVTNLADQAVLLKKSHYNIYKQMVAFRKSFENIVSDSVSLIKLSEYAIQIIRRTSNSEYVYLFNSGEYAAAVYIYSNDVEYQISVTSDKSQRSIGDILSNPVELQPHECLVLERYPQTSGANGLTSTWFLSVLTILFLFNLQY